MEYQKIINSLDSTPYRLFKFRTNNWIKINDQSRKTYGVNSDIRFKTKMLMSSLWHCSNVHIFIK